MQRAADAQPAGPSSSLAARRRRRGVDATETDLDAGLSFLLDELRKLSEAYPDEAERLRITASIEAIDGRLREVTVGAQ